MPIGKWIPFSGAPNAGTDNQIVKSATVQVISSADAKKFGLENFGNTCYANSVLQTLYFCSPFRDLLLQYSDSSSLVPAASQTPTPSSAVRRKPERKPSNAGQSSDALVPNGPTIAAIPSSPPTLSSALRSLFLYISKNPAERGTVAPRAFIDKLKDVNELFRSTMHQDAHEFLNYLLNRIVEEIEEERRQKGLTPSGDDLSNSAGTLPPPTVLTATSSSNSGASPNDATLVHRLFEGVLTSETRCLTCETVSSRDETFLDLSIDIEQNSSVTACLRQFSASEMLCQKNKFFCDSCCDLQEAEKRMKIKKLPNVLALHLKRFKYQEDVQKYIKLAYRVAFPFELRLFNTVDDTDDADRLFELFGIVVHIGNGPHHGHYISIVKTMGSWLVFDDDAVDPIRESDIPKYFGESNAGSAYVLYYQAVDIDVAALGLRPPPPEQTEQTQVPLQPSLDPPDSSPQASAPALPPGLEDSDAPDDNEPLSLSTPSPLPQPLPFLDHPASADIQQDGPSQLLKVPVPSPQDPPPTPASSPGNNSPAVALFKSLRHSPSIKIRASLSSSEARKSLSERITRPHMSSEGLHSEDPVKSPVHSPEVSKKEKDKEKGKDKGTDREKEVEKSKSKETDRKSSTWFKRISIKRPTTVSGPRSPAMAQSPKDPHPSSNILDPGTLSPLVAEGGHSPSTSDKHSRWGREPINGYESQSVGSVSSSTGSASADPSHHASPGVPPLRTHKQSSSTGADPLNTFPSSPIPSPSSVNATTSDLPSDGKRSNGLVPIKLPPRPATAGAATGRTILHTVDGPIPPVPPLPPLPSSARIAHTLGNGRIPGSFEDPVKGTIDTGDDSSSGQPPSSAGADLDTEFPSTDQNAVEGDISTRPARRKLSFTAPLLAFGKKDREKHKGREKERRKENKPKTPELQASPLVALSLTTRF